MERQRGVSPQERDGEMRDMGVRNRGSILVSQRAIVKGFNVKESWGYTGFVFMAGEAREIHYKSISLHLVRKSPHNYSSALGLITQAISACSVPDLLYITTTKC